MDGYPLSSHTRFFTSLKQVEKRLKLDATTAPPLTDHPETVNNTQQTDSLGTPLYLNSINNTNATSNLQESEAPQEFLSDTPHFQGQDEEAHIQEAESSSLDYNIGLLMQLLRLSEPKDMDVMMGRFEVDSDDGFYGKVVGVKGPKTGKEGERLDRWIKHFLNNNNNNNNNSGNEEDEEEPFRLAHLLLGKAALVHSVGDGDGDGFGGFEFPSTVDEFLHNDPPMD